MALDRELQLAAALGRGRGVAAPVPDAVDLDRDLNELPRGEPLPSTVGAEGKGGAVGGLSLDPEHLGPALPGNEQGVDLLQVAVDPVRAREGVEEAEPGSSGER